jgi:PhzF family phenazine biosynthesis protein
MKIRKYQIDAFAEKVFTGNPAVVCPVHEFPSEVLMQAIASEHNLSETAFIVKKDQGYVIRWFTPSAEVELCGHATLASAFVIFEMLGHQEESILFHTLYRGDLSVTKKNGMYELDFPSTPAVKSDLPFDSIQGCFDVPIISHFDGKTDCLVVLSNEIDVKKAKPDMAKLASLDRRGIMITSESSQYDFVSRFFGPKVGVPEDPVTGSAHTLLIPFWSKRLNKINMIARQESKRGGILYCTYLEDRVRIAGHAVKYSEGEIHL